MSIYYLKDIYVFIFGMLAESDGLFMRVCIYKVFPEVIKEDLFVASFCL